MKTNGLYCKIKDGIVDVKDYVEWAYGMMENVFHPHLLTRFRKCN
jgi:hypothetical protein